MTAPKKYQSLDLLKGLAKGWDEQHSLSIREARVLAYVAQHGRQNEPGYAFTWHPMKGLDWWAEDMTMPVSTLYRVLASLKKKGLLTQIPANTKWRCKGYAITLDTMDEILTHERKILTHESGSLTDEN